MAWSEKRPNGHYRGAYRDRDGTIRYVKGTFSHPAEAEREAHDAENRRRRPGAINLDGARMPGVVPLDGGALHHRRPGTDFGWAEFRCDRRGGACTG
ncbi:hypothetical protein [Saccharopolyspora shandongensis]|uniref:hypothetical protein n=1 Tax=Saccharopolyspora shandongensis TaxID=418495 RepID=UPI0033F4C0FA